MSRRSRARHGGFSLVEILIVVVILGILAAIAIPKFANASQLAKENALKDDLRLLRTQLGVYKSQHALYPGYPGGNGGQTPTAQATYDQLLLFSDSQGNTSATLSDTYKWGQYLSALPANPINDKKDWRIIADGDPFTPDNSTGWMYQPSTGIIRANCTGADSNGKAIVDY